MMDDLDRIMLVMDAAFDPHWGEAWNRRQVSESLVFPNTHYILVNASGLTLAEDEAPAGFALVRAAPGEEELLLIAIDPAYRRRGIGSRLLELVAQDARTRGASEIFLEVRENNEALSFYQSFGFAPIGRRTKYYRLSDGTRLDAVTLSYSL